MAAIDIASCSGLDERVAEALRGFPVFRLILPR
jgi:hypothetical protein